MAIKRPLLLFSAALAAGILIAQISRSWRLVLFTIVFLGAVGALIYCRVHGLKLILIGALLFYTVGAFEFLWLNGRNEERFKEFSGQQVTLRGVIDSVPDIRESKVAYVLKVRKIRSGGAERDIGGRILLTTVRSGGEYIFEYGREVAVEGQLNLPGKKRNPGGFDYRKYLAQSGISATLFASGEHIRPGEKKPGNPAVKVGFFLREKIIGILDRTLPPEPAGLMQGMLIGYREGLSKEVQQAFSDAGLSHLMAVSGMNIAFIVLPLAYLLKKLKFRKRTANPMIIAVLVVFVFITGFSPSVLRAVIMGIVILTGEILYRETDVYTSIAFATILLLLYSPYNLFDIGFQLSFAATLSLVLFYGNIKQWIHARYMPGAVADVLAATLAAQAGVLPITVFYFNKFSIISLVSNLLVVPLVEVITIAGTLMVLLGSIHILFAQILGYINCSLLTFVLFVTKTSARLPFAAIKLVTPSIGLILLYYAGILFFLWYKPLRKVKIDSKIYGMAAAVAVLLLCLNLWLPRGLEVVFIDVGQGDSTFIRSHTGKTVLVDGGGYNSRLNPDANIGDTVIVPFLLDYGVTRVDLVVGTHGHEDHIQGLAPVLKNMPVGRLILPETVETDNFKELLDIAAEKNVPVSACAKGDRIKLDDETSFDVLNPEEGFAPVKSAVNNSSLVLKLYYKNIRMLLTGDVEAEAEELLLADAVDLHSDLIKIAHHGSPNSTGAEFLAAVNPKAAVISVGKNNFGHPSGDVIERLADRSVHIFRTDRDGAVMVASDGNKLKIRKMIN